MLKLLIENRGDTEDNFVSVIANDMFQLGLGFFSDDEMEDLEMELTDMIAQLQKYRLIESNSKPMKFNELIQSLKEA